MNEFTPFEEKVRKTYHKKEAEPAFVNRLESKLMAYRPAPAQPTTKKPAFDLRWAYAAAFALLLGVAVLAIGPSKVWAQIQLTFGYIPGRGIVDSNAQFRQLAEPVTAEQEGIRLTVFGALLSEGTAQVDVRFSAVPEEIRGIFGKPECNEAPYLQTKSGAMIPARSSSMIKPEAADGSIELQYRFEDGLPAEEKTASLVFPCVRNTKRGTGPKDWVFDFSFVPADEQTIYALSLIEAEAATQPEPDPNAVEAGSQDGPGQAIPQSAAAPMPAESGRAEEAMTLFSVLDRGDSYWVSFYYDQKSDNSVNHNGMLTLEKALPVVYNADGQAQEEPGWELLVAMGDFSNDLFAQFREQNPSSRVSPMFVTMPLPKTGLAYPAKIVQTVLTREFPEPEAFADFEFDTSLVKAGDPLVLNQEISIGSIKVLLVRIEQAEIGPGGYRFVFDGTESKVNQVSTEILGHPADIGMSGNGSAEDPYQFGSGSLYFNAPTGKLTLRVSQPAVITGEKDYTGTWSPE